MMGLLTGYQDDADRLARQDKNLARTYNHDLRGIKAEAAPLESTVKDYNAQVEGFKNSAVSRTNDTQPGGSEIWNIIGWVSANSGYPRVVAHQLSMGGSQWYHGGAGDMYAGSFSNNNGGGWYWKDSDKATLRSAKDGTPISQLANGYGADQFYASWNDRPFVAPVTQSKIDTAKSADAKLIDLGNQGEAISAEADAARGLLTKKSDRIADDIEMNAGRLREEVAPTQQTGSVFDQNMAGIHQTIADWLHQ